MARNALSHPAGELAHVELVAPCVDLAVTDFEGPHDRQLERLVRGDRVRDGLPTGDRRQRDTAINASALKNAASSAAPRLSDHAAQNLRTNSIGVSI